MINSVYKF